MVTAWHKNNRREIRHTLGRFLAIMAIVALGVGFFAGLRVTRRAMVEMGDRYITENRLYDYRLISTIGFTGEDVAAFAALDGISAAEGIRSTDFLSPIDGQELAFRAISLPELMNDVQLTDGRMPQASNECLGDGMYFTPDQLGSTLTILPDGTDLREDQLTIVGLCNAVTYMYPERGTGKLGKGSVTAFVYLPHEAFDLEVFTEIDLTLTETGEIFSDEKNEALEKMEQPIHELMDQRIQRRFDGLIADARAELDEAQAEYDLRYDDYLSQRELVDSLLPDEIVADLFADVEQQLDEASQKLTDARIELDSTEDPSGFCLSRTTNTGYSGFENDSNVVDGISKVFPIFFFLVAALVCMTTMTRMVEEQRTQIGTLKALGYSNGKIISKYSFYAGSASLLGCVIGFLGGTWLFPRFIWEAYKMMYRFSEISYVFDWPLAVISVAVALLCSVGSTYAACRTELLQMPAQLMRPKAPKAGKRVLLERMGFVWNRLSFLQKVSIRNIFRYKKRLLMMLMGIGGCTALLLTGFGVSDSVAGIVNDQFDTITRYELGISFRFEQTEAQRQQFKAATADLLTDCVFVAPETYQVKDGGNRNLNVIATDDPDIIRIIGLQSGSRTIPYPTGPDAVVTDSLADAADVAVGEPLMVHVSDTKVVPVTISGISTNYVYHYLYMTSAGFEEVFGTPCRYTLAYATCTGDPYEVAAKLQSEYGADSVSVVQDLRDRVDNMMVSLNAIIWLVIGCACALAFVVMYNLSNINITERLREIATIKVLGFYPGETHQYVFRENLVLSMAGMVLGVPFGFVLHRFMMSQIRISVVAFNIHIAPLSYLWALLVVLGMTFFVNLVLNRKIDKIHMAESLKSVE